MKRWPDVVWAHTDQLVSAVIQKLNVRNICEVVMFVAQVCSTPMLNSRVAGDCEAASIPIDIHILVSNGSMIASSHSRAAA